MRSSPSIPIRCSFLFICLFFVGADHVYSSIFFFFASFAHLWICSIKMGGSIFLLFSLLFILITGAVTVWIYDLLNLFLLC
jgi:dipeptide/tripeptide permease